MTPLEFIAAVTPAMVAAVTQRMVRRQVQFNHRIGGHFEVRGGDQLQRASRKVGAFYCNPDQR